ncbi:MAG: methyltransferase domain-containing protein [Proteobacteria bacterium]|nr:methyltransferase domain-containing protein [Pseudomonadota bacterium]
MVSNLITSGHPAGDHLDELTDDAVAGEFRLWQRRRGHRYSLDDVATAWEAALALPEALHCLDLGCGVGSVLHMLAYRMPRAHFVGVEAEPVSFRLAERNVARNNLSGRCRLIQGDLRTCVDPLALGRFDLVTGTPPYWPPGTATASPDRQRAAARIELRGGIEVYLSAAARVVSPAGRVVVCADARHPERVEQGARGVGLTPVRRRDVVPIVDRKRALFSVWTLGCALAGSGCERARTLVTRDSAGARTADAQLLRSFFGLPPSAPCS